MVVLAATSTAASSSVGIAPTGGIVGKGLLNGVICGGPATGSARQAAPAGVCRSMK
ncbi:MAG: hypothetical protein IPK19_42020 [Chloroflexi bacterium]|nr:hypothetical protein [Chloroflexota bacterium]